MYPIRSLALAALFCTLGAGCLGDPAYQPPTPLRARLVPVGGSTVVGTVEAISQGRGDTEAGLNIVGRPSTTYGWQINQGTCEQPGAVLGGVAVYPDFRTASDTIASDTVASDTTRRPGRGRVDRIYIARLMARDQDYHAIIVNADTRSIILACGNFDRIRF